MPMRERSESRKKRRDGTWLNPKCQHNGESASKPRIAEGSTTIPIGSRPQAIGGRSGRRPKKDEDIVYSPLK